MEDIEKLMAENARLLAENERLRSNCYPRDGVEAIIRERDAAVKDINSMLKNVDSVICCHYCAKSEHGKYCGFDSEGENGELINCPAGWRGPMAGKEIKYKSMSAAARAVHVGSGAICCVCKGITGYKTAGGYKWRYAE